MTVTRTFDLLNRYQENFDKEDALIAKENGKWVKYSTQQYIDLSHAFSAGLLNLGFKKGDKIVTVSNNRPEWNFVDMGMAMIGVVHVPVFPSLSTDEYKHILEHSDAKAVIVSDKKLYQIIIPAFEQVKDLKNFYSFDKIEGVKNWMEIIESGRKNADQFKEEIERIKKEIIPDDFATLIYTSGTTGTAKGVMLSHKNLVRNFLAAAEVFCLKPEDKYLSVLPLCHVGGRMGNYQTQFSGTGIYYAENMGTIAVNMREIKPTGFDAVPRIMEKIYDTVIAKGKKLPQPKKSIFFWAVKLGLKYKADGNNGWFYNRKLKIADKLIFSKWREALGGNIRLVGCGGATLQPRLEKIFWACGIKVLNMYGLTETSPVITINKSTKPDFKLGTVGKLIKGVDVKIAEDGEVLCKGHNVMLGYYKDPELTKSVFDDDGWFHTGDVGSWDKDKFLKITDRKKEIFKLSNGKFIAPQIIENRIKESIFVDQIMVIGEHEKFASALISPNFAYFKDWCASENIAFENNEELIQLPQILTLFNEEVMRFNKTFSTHERINRFKLVPDEWSPATGELSPTLKLRRKNIEEKYLKLLEQIYIKQPAG
ncbi:MAG: long-chain fatty acid--CoA ligase [Bacteroidales bacterium]|nr:long-chain fatty acid--CoA ligase [Bacteroidales bacterium]